MAGSRPPRAARGRAQWGRGRRELPRFQRRQGQAQDLPNMPPKALFSSACCWVLWGCRIRKTASRYRRSQATGVQERSRCGPCAPRCLPGVERQDQGARRADPAAGRSRRVRRWRRETERDTGFVSETLPLEQGGSFETVPRREKLHKGEGLVGRRGCGSRENGE